MTGLKNKKGSEIFNLRVSRKGSGKREFPRCGDSEPPKAGSARGRKPYGEQSMRAVANRFVLSQMFDVKPVTGNGDLDVQRIKKVAGVLDLRGLKTKADLAKEEDIRLATKVLDKIKERPEVKIAISRVIVKKEKKKLPAQKPKPAIKTKPKTTLVAAPLFAEMKQEDSQQKEYFSSQLGGPINDVLPQIKKQAAQQPAIEQKELEAVKPIEQIPDDYLEMLMPDVVEEVPAEEPLSSEPEISLLLQDLPTKEDLLAELSQIDQEDQALRKKIAFKEKKPLAGQVKKKKPIKKIEPVLAEKPIEKLDGGISFEKILQEKLIAEEVEKKEEPIVEEIKEELKTKEKKEDLQLSVEFLKNVEDDEIFENTLQKELFAEKSKKKIKIKVDKKLGSVILTVSLIAVLGISLLSWLNQGFKVSGNFEANSLAAYQSLLSASQSFRQTELSGDSSQFSPAYSRFIEASQQIDSLNQLASDILKEILDQRSSETNQKLVELGQSITKASQSFSEVASILASFNFATIFSGAEVQIDGKLNQSISALNSANQGLDQLQTEGLDNQIKENILSIKKQLPQAIAMTRSSIGDFQIILDILGHDKAKKYLLLFQDTTERRATGGLINTYGLLSLQNGMVKDIFVEGTSNADSQLREKIIPPKPIQKVSTTWSMHDANWFLDFPTSAQKIAWFYEKISSQKVDGAISITPKVVQRLLELTGPIAMPQYDVLLDAQNFVETIQFKVELDYDKELNQPNKILTDFTSLFITALGNLSEINRSEALKIIADSLSQREIMFYSTSQSAEDFIKDQGWAGQVLDSSRDFLAVVSSNIGGEKTDQMIEEKIEHLSEIQSDGSIIDTVTITKTHNASRNDHEWLKATNVDYIRLYLPKGSQFISVTGQSKETYKPPIDYLEQGFTVDPLVASIERLMSIDSKSGTDIFEESNKTVFGNWFYTKVGRSASLTYKYKLPFKINLTEGTDNYSLLVQKQPGADVQFETSITYPDNWQVTWPDSSEWGGQIDLTEDELFSVDFVF